MEIVDKINYLLNKKKMLKKNFAQELQALEPKLKSTGDVPNIQTIYGYLSGKRELKVELIPYIAKVLNIQEQELFTPGIEDTNEINEILTLLQYAPKPLRQEIKELLTEIKKSSHQKLNDIKSNI